MRREATISHVCAGGNGVVTFLQKRYNEHRPETEMHEIDLMYQTMLAELAQRSLDGDFVSEYPVEGRFVTQVSREKEYYYFVDPETNRRSYVGRKDDEEIAQRVERFNALKNDVKSRRRLVSTLTREGGMAAPVRFTGDVVAALADAGLFRLRAVLVGTVAYSTYPGILGVRLPASSMQTGDADFAQFHSISTAVGDSIPPILDVLRKVDPSFREVPHQSGGARSTQFQNNGRYKVEFVTPNTGSDDHMDKPADMPALGGAGAEPLRFLDYLIHDPVRTVLLHKAGVTVNVPRPERYAVHKLILSTRRGDDAYGELKREKDLRQSTLLMEALVQTRRHYELAEAFTEAWDRGPSWQDGIQDGISYLRDGLNPDVAEGVVEGIEELALDPRDYGFDGPSFAP